MAQKLSAKEAARELDTDAKTFRKFLRSDQSPVEPVGQGKRYEFTKTEVNKLKKAFLAWGSTKATRKPKDEEIDDDVETEHAIEEIDIDEGLGDGDEPDLDDDDDGDFYDEDDPDEDEDEEDDDE